MEPQIHNPTAWAYIRLSRDDDRQPGTIDEKFAIRKVIVQRLADQHGLTLPDDQIIVEQGSGGKLSTRPAFLRLLALAEKGSLPHLITPYVDRLLRGDKRDEEDIQDALCLGLVRVYTTEQEYPIQFGPDYDPTVFEIKALVARTELRGTIRKRRETDRARLQVGRRSRGPAPYGYRYLSPVYDQRRELISPAKHVTEPHEFDLMVEAWQRIRNESLAAICSDFNARKVAPPAEGKRTDAAVMWTPVTLRNIFRNPFYAGYLSQRSRVVRGQKRRLDVDDFVLSENAGEWPAIVSLEEWREIQDILRGRYRSGSWTGLLTGLLRNAVCGNPMFKQAADSYRCGCGKPFHGKEGPRPIHASRNLSAPKIEAWTRDLVTRVVLNLPSDALTRPRKRSAAPGALAIRSRLIAVQRDLSEARQRAEDMVLRRAYYIQQFGTEIYEGAAKRATEDFNRLQSEQKRLSAEAEQPDLEAMLPVVLRFQRALSEGGVLTTWESVPLEEQSLLLRAIIRSITVSADAATPGAPSGYIWSAEVEYWPWIEAISTPPPAPPIPRRWSPQK